MSPSEFHRVRTSTPRERGRGEVSVQCVIDIAIRVLNGGNKEACATYKYNSGNLVERGSPGRLTNMTQLGVNSSFSLDQATKTILSTLRTLVVVFSTKVNRKMLAQKEGSCMTACPMPCHCHNSHGYAFVYLRFPKQTNGHSKVAKLVAFAQWLLREQQSNKFWQKIRLSFFVPSQTGYTWIWKEGISWH